LQLRQEALSAPKIIGKDIVQKRAHPVRHHAMSINYKVGF